MSANSIPADFVLGYLAERAANPRGMMPSHPVRWWTGGVHPDVDTGRARSTQCAYCIPPGDVISRSSSDPEISSGRAADRWRNRHARWITR